MRCKRLGLFTGSFLLLCVSFCFGASDTWPVKVRYVIAQPDSFSWYYVNAADWQKNDWDKRIICRVDRSGSKWMRLNGKDLKLKNLSAPLPNDAGTKGGQFLETYAAGHYRVRMDYLQTNDPKAEKSDFIAYDVKFTITRGNRWITFKAKCKKAFQ
jgi:hypothetical protein